MLLEIMVAIILLISIIGAIAGLIANAKLNKLQKKVGSDPVLLLQNSLSGSIRIQEMLVEYKSSPNPQLCKLIQDAIKNWNANFSVATGHTIPNITCP